MHYKQQLVKLQRFGKCFKIREQQPCVRLGLSVNTEHITYDSHHTHYCQQERKGDFAHFNKKELELNAFMIFFLKRIWLAPFVLIKMKKNKELSEI